MINILNNLFDIRFILCIMFIIAIFIVYLYNVNSKTKFVSGTSFLEELDKINQQIESDVELENKLIEEMID